MYSMRLSKVRGKGQSRVVFEILMILIGIIMTSYVIIGFNDIQKSATNITVNDNFNTIANEVLIAVAKVSVNNNSIIRLTIPEKVSDHVYKIVLDDDSLYVVSLTNPDVNITRQLFNIGQANRIIKSEAVSSARAVEIISENNSIRIRRGL